MKPLDISSAIQPGKRPACGWGPAKMLVLRPWFRLRRPTVYWRCDCGNYWRERQLDALAIDCP
jgi:hypothetical protein